MQRRMLSAGTHEKVVVSCLHSVSLFIVKPQQTHAYTHRTGNMIASQYSTLLGEVCIFYIMGLIARCWCWEGNSFLSFSWPKHHTDNTKGRAAWNAFLWSMAVLSEGKEPWTDQEYAPYRAGTAEFARAGQPLISEAEPWSAILLYWKADLGFADVNT